MLQDFPIPSGFRRRFIKNFFLFSDRKLMTSVAVWRPGRGEAQLRRDKFVGFASPILKPAS